MKRVVSRAILNVVLLLCCAQAAATPVTFAFSGRVIASWGTLTYLQLQSVQGQFFYDSDWPAFITTTASAFYAPTTSHYGIVFSIGTDVFDSRLNAAAIDHALRIDNDRQPFNDARIEDALTYHTLGIMNYLLVLGDATQLPDIPDALSSTNLYQLLEFETFNNTFGAFQIRSDDNNSELGRIYFSITSLELVPEPATILLFAIGIGSIGYLRRRESAR